MKDVYIAVTIMAVLFCGSAAAAYLLSPQAKTAQCKELRDDVQLQTLVMDYCSATPACTILSSDLLTASRDAIRYAKTCTTNDAS
jgi:hypothetical protein